MLIQQWLVKVRSILTISIQISSTPLQVKLRSVRQISDTGKKEDRGRYGGVVLW